MHLRADLEAGTGVLMAGLQPLPGQCPWPCYCTPQPQPKQTHSAGSHCTELTLTRSTAEQSGPFHEFVMEEAPS